MRRALTALAVTAACAAPAEAPAPPPPTTVAPPTPQPPTTVAPMTVAVATTLPPTTPVHRARAAAVATPDDAFWRRLADCECASGQCGGGHVSFFQFSPDTARKVGIDGSEPYEEQRAAAQEWARRIHPNEGTRSGWLVCWWEAA